MHHRQTLIQIFVLAFLLCLAIGISSPLYAEAADSPITLIYTSNFQGEIEPCGCTMDGDFGGVPRRVTMLDRLREEDENLVLISSGGIFNDIASTQNIINHAIVNGFKMIRFDAIGIQKKDFAPLAEHPLLAELNWVNSGAAKTPFHTDATKTNAFYVKTIERKQAKLHFYSLPKTEEFNPAVLQALQQSMQEKKSTGTIILSIESRSPYDKQIQPLLDEALIQILIRPKRDEFYEEASLINKTIVLQPGNRGMRLGKLVFDPQSPSKNFKHKIIPLGIDVPDSPRTTQWYEAYNQTVRAFFDKEAAVKAKDTSKTYVGAETCKTCHLAVYDTWSKTLHAHAISKLENENKAFDPNCIGCHVAGYNEPGGYINQEKTPHLANVQCESCHGAGYQHTQSPIMEKPTLHKLPSADKCLQCHNKEHSPKFDFKTYWPRVAH